jgi:hypothetical protein
MHFSSFCHELLIHPSICVPSFPGWKVGVKDDLDSIEVCHELVDHFAPPVTAERLQDMNDASLNADFVRSIAHTITFASECLFRWGDRKAIAQSAQKRVAELERRLRIRDGELDVLEGKFQRLQESKKRLFQRYTTQLHEGNTVRSANAALSVENERLKLALEETRSRPALLPGQIVINESVLEEKDLQIRSLQEELAALRSALAQKEDQWSIDKTALENRVEVLNRRCTEFSVDNVWLVEEGLKEFMANLLGSSEFLVQRSRLCLLAKAAGFVEGMREGHQAARQKVPLSAHPSYDPSAIDRYDEACTSDAVYDFPYLNALAAQAGQPLTVLRGIRPHTPSME